MMIHLAGHVQQDELREMTDKTRVLLDEGIGKVHALVDYSKTESIPKSLSTFVSEIKREKDPKQGITILIMPELNILAQFVFNTLMQMIGLEFRQVKTMAEALEVLKRTDQTLEGLL